MLFTVACCTVARTPFPPESRVVTIAPEDAQLAAKLVSPAGPSGWAAEQDGPKNYDGADVGNDGSYFHGSILVQPKAA